MDATLRSLKCYYNSGIWRHLVVKDGLTRPSTQGCVVLTSLSDITYLWEEIPMGGGKHKVKKKYARYTYIFTVNLSNQNINKSSFK